ncbi:MAG: hypothetical protein PHR43_03530 [Dehalococcoidales bacterium]|nr:hypothetical protein [Dehalococcoidales bacterium]
MSIEWWRDLVLVIFGIAATVLVLFSTVLIFMVYRRIKVMLKSVAAVTGKVEDIVSCVEEDIIKPLSRLAAFIQGVRQAVSMMHKFYPKKED